MLYLKVTTFATHLELGVKSVPYNTFKSYTKLFNWPICFIIFFISTNFVIITEILSLSLSLSLCTALLSICWICCHFFSGIHHKSRMAAKVCLWQWDLILGIWTDEVYFLLFSISRLTIHPCSCDKQYEIKYGFWLCAKHF